MDNQTNSTQLTQDLDDKRMIEVFKVFLKTFERNIRILEGLNQARLSSPPPLTRLETTGYTTPPAEPKHNPWGNLRIQTPDISEELELVESPSEPKHIPWGNLRIQIPNISEELELVESPAELEEEFHYNLNPEELLAEYTDTRPSCEECSGCKYCQEYDSYDGSDGYDS